MISFFDLAGHERYLFTFMYLSTCFRYLKTTMYGMSGQMPDYSFLVVDAETGVGG